MSWVAGEEEMPRPAMPFLNAGSLRDVCFQQAFRRSSSPEVWNSLSGEIYVSLPKESGFLLGKMVLYDSPKQSQLCGVAQVGHRFGFATYEKIRKAQFEQLARSQICKSLFRYSMGCFNCWIFFLQIISSAGVASLKGFINEKYSGKYITFLIK